MKRITLILGVVAVMVVMLVALAAPAMAKDNGGHHNNGRHLGQVHKNLNHLGKDRPFNQFNRPFVNHVNINPGFPPVI